MKQNTERISGYYWVKYHGEWIISLYDDNDKLWEIIGYLGTKIGKRFEEINENIINKPHEGEEHI